MSSVHVTFHCRVLTRFTCGITQRQRHGKKLNKAMVASFFTDTREYVSLLNYCCEYKFPSAGSCVEFNELPNASKCQKVQRKTHNIEHGTDRDAETEINSLACSISQLIFHEGFSPSPPPVFFRL